MKLVSRNTTHRQSYNDIIQIESVPGKV